MPPALNAEAYGAQLSFDGQTLTVEAMSFVAKGALGALSLGAGGGRGSFIPGPEGPTSIDQGRPAITNTRILFHGPRQSREWDFAKLTGIDHATDGSWTALTVTNCQITSGAGYPPARLKSPLPHDVGKG